MPSSTSNSNQRAPRGHHAATWALTALLAAVIFAGGEWALRRRGFVPSVTDDRALWAHQRDRLRTGETGKTVVVLGTSRMLRFQPKVLADACPGTDAVLLGVAGQHPLATLRDLADDENFRGVALCEYRPDTYGTALQEDQQRWVDFYHRTYGHLGRWQAAAGKWAELQLQRRFAILNPRIGVRYAVRGRLHRPEMYKALQLFPDRSRAFHPSATEPDRWAKLMAERQEFSAKAKMKHLRRRTQYVRQLETVDITERRARPDTWYAQVSAMRPLVQRIQARGGQVVFFMAPNDGPLWDLQLRLWPRQKYWDRLASATGAVTIHFLDVPDLRNMTTVDHVHIAPEDAPLFTKAIAEEMIRLGVLDGPNAPASP